MRVSICKDLERKWTGPLLDQVYLGCSQRECKPNQKIFRKNKKLFESLILARTIVQLPGWERSDTENTAWSNDIEINCEEMGGNVLRIGKQEIRPILQSLHTVFR